MPARTHTGDGLPISLPSLINIARMMSSLYWAKSIPHRISQVSFSFFLRLMVALLLMAATGNLSYAQDQAPKDTVHPAVKPAAGSPLTPAQRKKQKRPRRNDSALMELNSRLSDSILQETDIKDTIVPNMVNKVESYSFSLNRAEAFLNRRPDTTGLVKTLSGLERAMNGLHNRLEKNANNINLRNLNTGAVLLAEAEETLKGWNTTLANYQAQMNANHDKIRTIKHDSTLQDSALDSSLHGLMGLVYQRTLSLDSDQHVAMTKISTLRNRVSVNTLLVQDIQTEIDSRTKQVRSGMWKPEERPFFVMTPQDYDVNLIPILTDALSRSFRVIKVFMGTTWDTRALSVGLWVLLFFWFMINVRHMRKVADKDKILVNLKFLSRRPLLCSLLLLFTYGSFFYPSAPAVYLHSNELARLIALGLLLFPFLTRPGRIIFLSAATLWLIFAIDDLLLDSAYGERWWLMTGALALFAGCIYLLWKKPSLFQNLEASPATKLVLILVLAQASISLGCNLSGRLTLSKLFAFSAIDSLMLAITLKVASTIVVDAVYIQSEEYRDNRFSAFLNFVDLKTKLRKILWVVTVVAWTFTILRDLTFYDDVYRLIDFFMSRKRTLGSITFNFGNLIVFILIIWLSSILSQFVSFFFSENAQIAGTQKKTKLGSIALVLRIGIWSAGVMIAVTAMGIPMSNLSILVGALGVGIGFGLQNLVNNLVSGIIIAFERPIQIGDSVEVSGKSGTVREIGVRSSRIANGEGADIIVPNGDLLSQQLINWTSHDRSKLVKITISVPYKSDFRKAKEIVEQEMTKEDRKFMKGKATSVSVVSLLNNTVNLEATFWVSDLNDAGGVRNALLLDIFESFSKGEIPMGSPDLLQLRGNGGAV